MSSECFEYLTTQTIVTSIFVYGRDSAKKTGSRRCEADRIFDLLKCLCALDEEAPLLIAGRAHSILPAGTGGGSSWAERPEGGCQGQLVLAAVDDRDRRVRLRFKLLREKGGNGRLTLSYDPTAMLTGADVHPTLAGEQGAMISFPSSSPRVMREMFRLGPSFLESLQCLLLKSKIALFDKAISENDIRIARVQLGVDLAPPDPDRFLQVLAITYGLWFSGDESAVQLATYHGLALQIRADGNVITAVTLRKAHGRKPLFTLNFTNKASPDGREAALTGETTAASNRLRFEITLHPDGVMQVISEARKRLKKLGPNLLGARAKEFLAADPEPTFWWLGPAIFILSHRPGGDIRTSFADWLVGYMLHEVLHLNVIAGFTAENLETLAALDDKVAEAWRAARYSPETNWATVVAEKAGCDEQTIYNRQKKWRQDYNIDIGAPFESYHGLLVVGPLSLTKPETRSALMAAISHGNPSTVLEVMAGTLRDFDLGRREVVGRTIDKPLRRIAVEMVEMPTTYAGTKNRKAARHTVALVAPAKGSRRPSAATSTTSGARQSAERPRVAKLNANRAKSTKAPKQSANGAKRPPVARAGAQRRGPVPSTRRTGRQSVRKR
jgi:hypothetical protein